MFERETRDAAGISNRSGSTDVFIFVGGALVFPNSILRIAEQEAGGVHALRLDTLRELQSLARDRTLTVRKVFFDDRMATDVLRNFDRYRADFPDADWILAYREQSVARRLLDERAQAPRLADILLLPMTLPICPWSSMLRLVLAGQFIASGDLIGPAASPQVKAAPPPAPRLQMQAEIAAESGETAVMTESIAGLPHSDPGLTRREKEVLALVSQGGRNKTIAHTMSLSEHTVKLHLHNAITKIGARNRTEAATWYLSRQLGEGR
ncbi:MAG: LuxR C-terminal-related transcriptional regulator [Paracoccaceae bacterium]